MTDIAVGCLRVLEQALRYEATNLINEIIFYLEESLAIYSEKLVNN